MDIMSLLGMPMQAFMKNFQTFYQNFRQQNGNISPQQMVQNLMNQGKMSQEQFNRFRDLANKITGMSM